MTKKTWLISIIILLIVIFGIWLLMNYYQKENNNNENNERTVSRNEAIEILNEGNCEQVFQSHSLDVTLTLKNGYNIYTKEPNIDDIFDEIKKCWETCKNIILSTE